MKLIIIFGPQAVWKMTVGHELEKITKLKLFHNHMTIDLIAPLFWYWSTSPIGTKIVKHIRTKIFKEFAQTYNEWLIFTYVRNFNKKTDRQFIRTICNIFRKNKWEVFLVELEANLDIRIKRNKTNHRLNHKPTKRNINRSEQELKESAQKYRLNSIDWEIKESNYIKIVNNKVSAKNTANTIKKLFKL